jgi:hypothetical protein
VDERGRNDPTEKEEDEDYIQQTWYQQEHVTPDFVRTHR